MGKQEEKDKIRIKKEEHQSTLESFEAEVKEWETECYNQRKAYQLRRDELKAETMRLDGEERYIDAMEEPEA